MFSFYYKRIINLISFTNITFTLEKLDKKYWNSRHEKGDTPWHIGQISPPLKAYFDQLPDKNIEILIPGAGHSHEVKYLLSEGFRHVTVCDISPVAIEKMKEDLQNYQAVKFITGDFFELKGKYDLIVEQTFFCALNPAFRKKYVIKMFDLLCEKGTLVGVLFASQFNKAGPPFGGDINEYNSLLSTKLHIHQMQMCYNSIPQRQGNELFIICKKENHNKKLH